MQDGQHGMTDLACAGDHGIAGSLQLSIMSYCWYMDLGWLADVMVDVTFWALSSSQKADGTMTTKTTML
jgi:hypothetical protein